MGFPDCIVGSVILWFYCNVMSTCVITMSVQWKKPKGYSSSGLGTVKEATQKTFEALVKYCEQPQ